MKYYYKSKNMQFIQGLTIRKSIGYNLLILKNMQV